MKKKLTAILLIASMVLSITACGNSKKSGGGDSEAEQEITIPASLLDMGDDSDLVEEMKESGATDVKENDDGSVTVKLTAKAHKKLLDDYKTEIDDSIKEILEDKEGCPSFDSITYNDDLTEFDVKVDSAKYNELQSIYALTFYIAGDIYQLLNNVPEDDLKTVVNFKNKDTGKVIDTGDSTGLEELKKELESLE